MKVVWVVKISIVDVLRWVDSGGIAELLGMWCCCVLGIGGVRVYSGGMVVLEEGRCVGEERNRSTWICGSMWCGGGVFCLGWGWSGVYCFG